MSADVAVGDIVAERTVHLSRESLVRYAGASGDFNPIHYRDDVAASVGLPGVLAHGMLTMGLAVETVIPFIGDSGRITDYGVRFARPVIVDPDSGAELRIVAKVLSIDAESGGLRLDLTVTHGETKVLVKAQLGVRGESAVSGTAASGNEAAGAAPSDSAPGGAV